MQVVRMAADNMMAVIERAMAAGTSVLIENMGEAVDAALNPIITRCVQTAAGEGQAPRTSGRTLSGCCRRLFRLSACKGSFPHTFLPHVVYTCCRATFKKGRSLYIKLGDKDVEYNK